MSNGNNSTDSDQVRVELGDGTEITNFTNYQSSDAFLQNCGDFSIEISDDRVDQLEQALTIGQTMTLSINGQLQATAYVEEFSLSVGRGGQGTTLHVSGRDKLGRISDSGIDENVLITKADSLESALRKTLARADFANIEIDDSANRNLITGAPCRYVGKTNRSKKTFIAHETQPYPGEGIYQYASRICKRFGFHIWQSADGQTLFIGYPTFNQDPIYLLNNYKNGISNNIITSSKTVSWKNQPSVIIGQGVTGNGQKQHGLPKCVMVNELLGMNDAVQAVIDKQKATGANVLDFRQNVADSVPRNLVNVDTSFATEQYLYDDESHTPAELEFAVRRKMATYQSQFFSYKCTVKGHSNDLIAGNAIYGINTIAKVIDEYMGINANMWISKRSFSKDRDNGTVTELELILPYTLDF